MLDNDKASLSYQSREVGHSAERDLLTPERSQKLDLLIHLLANLRQALILCGPNGIGKTTLLNIFRVFRKDQWQICLLQGSSNLSFETIVIELNQFLDLSHSKYGFDLTLLRKFCEKQTVVLMIDDAGSLVPGLIGELIDLADSLSGLRLVFSMTYDEFHIKCATDKLVDDCHLIELPPLSLKQCYDYLQNLSAQPGAMVSFNAVTEQLVAALYRETHGIPGKILAKIPELNRYQSRKKSRLGLWLAVTVIVVLAGWCIKWLLPSTQVIDAARKKLPQITIVTPHKDISNSTGVPANLPATDVHVSDQQQQTSVSPLKPTEIKPEAAKNKAITLPQIEPNAKQEKIVQPQQALPLSMMLPESGAKLQTIIPVESTVEDKPKIAAQMAIDKVLPQNSPPTSVQPPPKTPEAKAQQQPVVESNQDWIMAQPADNFTLQVMVLSNKAAANRFLKKYSDYNDNLKYYAIGSDSLEKYVLIYGSFKTMNEALQSKALLPGEFKQAIEKRFRAIQKDSRRKSQPKLN